MTELLDTIDDTIAAWEAQPEAWNPGDPLYEHPNLRRGCIGGAQHVAAPPAPAPTLTVQGLEEIAARLRRSQPASADAVRCPPARPGVVMFIPTVADITAPTAADLLRGVDMSDLVVRCDLAAGSLVTFAAVVRRPVPAHEPRRLSIDGRAYRRRALARRRRNR